MNTAQEINFIHAASLPLPMVKRSHWDTLAKLPVLSKLVQPICSREALYGANGGFVFEYEPAISTVFSPIVSLVSTSFDHTSRLASHLGKAGTATHSNLASGLIGTLVFGLIGGLLATSPMGSSPISMIAQSNMVNRLTTQPASSITAADSIRADISTSEVEAVREQLPPKPPTPAKSMAATQDHKESVSAEEKLNMQKEVFGFLPYWYIDSAKNINFDVLTTLAYFDLGLLSNGAIDTSAPGWAKLNTPSTQEIFNEARQHNTEVVLTFTVFQNQTIEGLLLSPESRDRAMNVMVDSVKQLRVDGINIDVEYQGNASPELRQAFTTFVRQVSKKMHTEMPESQVTVSMYAGSAKYSMLYEVKPLSEVTDGIFIMAYDFSTASSERAAPNAPLTGSPKTYWYDISSAIGDFLASGAHPDKLILGVPYYGYDWPTSGQAPKSVVVPGRSRAVTYDMVRTIIEQHGGVRKWDYEAQSPYVAYHEGGQERVIYYDDAESLALKYDAINAHNLKGAGIWALGQDGGADELWELLERKFSTHE